jgi:hypothetical protein
MSAEHASRRGEGVESLLEKTAVLQRQNPHAARIDGREWRTAQIQAAEDLLSAAVEGEMAYNRPRAVRLEDQQPVVDENGI